MNLAPDGKAAAEILHETARLNREDPLRTGSLLTFPSAGQLVVTGDFHGHLRNFDKLQRFCALKSSPARMVLLHELIHTEPDPPGTPDFSIDLLVRAAQWKCDFPDNVFFIQSNHELSQLVGHEITKGGRYVLADFDRGVRERYGAHGDDVLDGVRDYIASLALAARTANGVFIAHSLPDPLFAESFDLTVFDREPTPRDTHPGGPAYALVWGRFHSEQIAEVFARRFNAQVLVIGHTPQEFGYRRIGRLLILASDHNHGVFLPIDLARPCTAESLEPLIRKFVSVE